MKSNSTPIGLRAACSGGFTPPGASKIGLAPPGASRIESVHSGLKILRPSRPRSGIVSGLEALGLRQRESQGWSRTAGRRPNPSTQSPTNPRPQLFSFVLTPAFCCGTENVNLRNFNHLSDSGAHQCCGTCGIVAHSKPFGINSLQISGSLSQAPSLTHWNKKRYAHLSDLRKPFVSLECRSRAKGRAKYA